VSGGSQSFNSVNTLRILGRWMRMFTIPNQSSIPMAYKQFTDAVDASNDEQAYIAAEGGSRLMASSNRDRVVDCMEEFVKYTIIMRQHFDTFGDRYSERTERRAKEKALVENQANKEAASSSTTDTQVKTNTNGTAGSTLVNRVNLRSI
jgi:arsenic resistance protein ArsH